MFILNYCTILLFNYTNIYQQCLSYLLSSLINKLLKTNFFNPPRPKGCQPCLDPSVCLQSADRFELFRRRLANGEQQFCRFR